MSGVNAVQKVNAWHCGHATATTVITAPELLRSAGTPRPHPPKCEPLRIHRPGVGMDVPGVGDGLGALFIGVFMSFIMESQQSFDCAAGGGAAFIIE